MNFHHELHLTGWKAYVVAVALISGGLTVALFFVYCLAYGILKVFKVI
jgi:hypothetical protein